jgi:hypothetical protein
MADSTHASPSGQASSRHPAWWLLGIAGAAALAVILYLVLMPIALVLNWSSHGDDVERQQFDRERQSATEAGTRLRAAAVDGELTDPEIAQAAGRLWSVERSSQELRVSTGYRPEAPIGAERCYVVVLSLPLGPATKNSLAVAPSCPRGPAVVPTPAAA